MKTLEDSIQNEPKAKYDSEKSKSCNEYRGPQWWINRQIKKNASTEERNTIELIKQYSQIFVQHDFRYKRLYREFDGLASPELPWYTKEFLKKMKSPYHKKDLKTIKQFLDRYPMYRNIDSETVRDFFKPKLEDWDKNLVYIPFSLR
jgi:hypothetical protein